jgi:hypothetical protein
MCVDEAGHDELAAPFNDMGDFAFTSASALAAVTEIAGAFNQDIADRRIADVAVMVVDAGAVDQERLLGGLRRHIRELCL